ncbi:hypothetical protein ACHQM5_024112 [Ranunculus cassubicifolius]
MTATELSSGYRVLELNPASQNQCPILWQVIKGCAFICNWSSTIWLQLLLTCSDLHGGYPLGRGTMCPHDHYLSMLCAITWIVILGYSHCWSESRSS